jgi:hypothetical protein
VVVIAVLAVVLVGAAVVLATGDGDDDEPAGPSLTSIDTGGGGDTPGSTVTDETTASDDPDEAAAEAVVRAYFQAAVDQDCPTMVASASPDVFAGGDPSRTPLEVCEDAKAAGMLDFDDYSLDRLEIEGNDGDTISFIAYEQLDGTGYTETIVLQKIAGDWKIDQIIS